MRKHLLVLIFYSALAVVLTWPLLLNFSTHVVGDGSDDPALTWNLWWFKHAVLDLQASPLSTDFMFYPIGINLAFYTLTLLNDALSLPLQAMFGLVPAANLTLLSSFVLSGYGTFLLVESLLHGETTDKVADERTTGMEKVPSVYSACPVGLNTGYQYSLTALIAGLVYAFSSNKMLYASLGQFNIASSQWIPFYVLYLFRMRRAPSVRRAWLAALFLLLQAYAEFTFASFLIVFTFFFALLQLRPLKSFIALARSLTLSALLFMLGFAPILIPMIQELRVEGDILVQGSGFAEAFSADVVGFFVPSQLNTFMGWLDGRFNFSYINFVFIGWLTLALALVGAWTSRRQWLGKFWTVSTLAFVLISLGPALRINGDEIAIPLPFSLFQLLPFFKGNRYPSRYSLMITLGVAVLVALGVKYLVAKGNKGKQRSGPVAERSGLGAMRGNNTPKVIAPHFLLFPLISLFILLEHVSIPLPLSDFRVPSFYQTIRDEPGDFTVLELPLAWRNGFRVTGTLNKIFMRSQYYQTVHEKRMLSGNTSRNPELKFQYFTEAPVINSLIALETGHPIDATTLEQDKRLAPDVFRFFNVRYIVLRPEAGDGVRPYLENILPELKRWREEHGVLVYRIEPIAPSQLSPAAQGRALRVDPKSPLARVYFAEGWGELGEQRVWAQRHETRLLLPTQNADSRLTFRLTIPGDGHRLTVLVNGRPIGTIALENGTKDYRLPLARRWMDEDTNEVLLRWEQLYPTELLPSEFGPRAPHHRFVVVKSAGEEVGDFAHIWIDGRDLSINQRGYNYVTFNPNISSTEPFSDHFDTFASADESSRLAQRVERGPGELNFSSFALAVRDEASRKLNANLVNALRAKGAKANLGWRWSHAFIRYEHAATNSKETFTLEDASPIRPAIVSIGERITAPQVAGAVEWIEIQPIDGAK